MNIKDRRLRKNAIIVSISHWERMIKFVADGGDFHKKVMLRSIGTTWVGDFCPLCSLYWQYYSCAECPLAMISVKCPDRSSIYQKIARARDVKSWLIASQEMLDMLKRAYNLKGRNKK